MTSRNTNARMLYALVEVEGRPLANTEACRRQRNATCREIAARMLASVSRGASAPMTDLAMIAEDLGHVPAGVQGVAREAVSIEVVGHRRKFNLASPNAGWSAKSSHFHDCSVPTEVKCGGQRSRR
jgi:hypothetical protein